MRSRRQAVDYLEYLKNDDLPFPSGKKRFGKFPSYILYHIPNQVMTFTFTPVNHPMVNVTANKDTCDVPSSVSFENRVLSGTERYRQCFV